MNGIRILVLSGATICNEFNVEAARPSTIGKVLGITGTDLSTESGDPGLRKGSETFQEIRNLAEDDSMGSTGSGFTVPDLLNPERESLLAINGDEDDDDEVASATDLEDYLNDLAEFSPEAVDAAKLALATRVQLHARKSQKVRPEFSGDDDAKLVDPVWMKYFVGAITGEDVAETSEPFVYKDQWVYRIGVENSEELFDKIDVDKNGRIEWLEIQASWATFASLFEARTGKLDRVQTLRFRIKLFEVLFFSVLEGKSAPNLLESSTDKYGLSFSDLRQMNHLRDALVNVEGRASERTNSEKRIMFNTIYSEDGISKAEFHENLDEVHGAYVDIPFSTYNRFGKSNHYAFGYSSISKAKTKKI